MNIYGFTFSNPMTLPQKQSLNNYLIEDRVHNEVIEQTAYDYYNQPQKEDSRPEQQDLLF